MLTGLQRPLWVESGCEGRAAQQTSGWPLAKAPKSRSWQPPKAARQTVHLEVSLLRFGGLAFVGVYIHVTVYVYVYGWIDIYI